MEFINLAGENIKWWKQFLRKLNRELVHNLEIPF